MTNEEVIQLIGTINDYADKKNNQGLKNTVLILLMSLVCSTVAAVIGYGWKEIVSLRDAKDEMKQQLVRMEVRHEVSLKEQNKMMFSIAGSLADVCEHQEKVKSAPVKPWSDFPEFKPKPERPKNSAVEKLFPKEIEDDKKFKDFHKDFEQRIQNKLPPQQMIQERR